MKIGPLLFVVPLLAAQDAPNIFSLEKEAKMGAQYAAEVRRQYKLVDNIAVNGYVQAVGNRLTARLASPTFPYRFEVLEDSAREPMSVPGGYVFLPAGVLLAVRDEAELAGMLAHAIAHVEGRHGMRSAARGQQLNLASIPLIYMGGWMGRHGSGIVPKAFEETHRMQEQDALKRGLELAMRAGFDPSALLRYEERTQPGTERLEALREAIVALPDRTYASAYSELHRTQQELRRSTPAFRERPTPTLRR